MIEPNVEQIEQNAFLSEFEIANAEIDFFRINFSIILLFLPGKLHVDVETRVEFIKDAHCVVAIFLKIQSLRFGYILIYNHH